MKKNSVAIILVNYNGIDDTIECIKSIEKIDTIDYKIIVVDNASKNSEAKKLQEIFPNIKVIESKENLGFSYGNNLGIKYALENDYEYVLLLNNDTIIDEKMIDNLLKYANSSAIVVPKMYYYSDNNRIWYAGGKINRFTGMSAHYFMDKLDNNLDQNVKECSFATGCCMLIHSDILNKIGNLSEEYFMYCEDTDFSLKAAENGIKILYVPSAKLWHKVSRSTGGSSSPFAIYYMTRNRFIYMKKHKSYFYFCAYLYTIITRYIRIIQYRLKKDDVYKSIKKAMKDYRNGVTGKVDNVM